ncbi:MAG TPA: sulfite exporter TauE/SafE family protein [Candidatus Limnocylindrales bacterium]|nr:sulfite exporter TauE/SafE family protein [Candidatus Limnocylindrales bacterium]
MNLVDAALIAAAGLAAGTINTIVGSGSLVTFPTLLALGYPPLTANVTNTVGLVLGTASGTYGYRAELSGQARRARLLLPAALAGGATGALLLLALPGTTFEQVVPWLILLAVALVIVQDTLAEWVTRWRRAVNPSASHEAELLAIVFVYLTGIYGGYFGAAQGVILIAVLGLFLPDLLQRTNAMKNLVAFVVNGVAAVIFAIVAPVDWAAALPLALGAIAGGQVGATLGRRLPAAVLRAAIIVIGTGVAVQLLIS